MLQSIPESWKELRAVVVMIMNSIGGLERNSWTI